MAASTYEPLAARPSLAGPGGAGLSTASLSSSPLVSVGYRLTLLYIVLLVGRVPELTTLFVGSSFYQILILNVVLLAIALISGILIKVGSTRGGTIWMAFHLWIVFTLPFSGYRRGSIESMMNLLVFIPGLFFLGGFLPRSGESLRRGLWALAWAGFVGLAFIQYSGAQLDEDRLVSVGTFGNSNLLAIYLLQMIPIWGYIVANSKYAWVVRALFGGAIVMALNLILKTGSRSGLMSVVLLSMILFFSVSLANKAKFLVIGVFGIFLAMGVMSDTLKARLSTIFKSAPRGSDIAEAEALGSSEARYQLLMDSIEATFKRPVVGAGFGVYSSVSATEKEKRGEHASWQVTHNMYTQISSEIGLPGFLLYLLGLSSNIRALWKARKFAVFNPEARDLAAIASALLCSWAVFLFSGCFASMALDFMMYILTGFSIATSLICEDMLRRQAQGNSFGSNVAQPRSPRFFPATPQPALAPAPVAALPAGSVSSGRAPVQVDDKYADAPWRRNPRKFPPKPGTPSR